MPDGDYLAWRAGGKWRKVANLLKAGASSTEVEDAMVAAIADSIRASGGVPQLAEVAESVRLAAVQDSHEALVQIPMQSRAGVMGRLLDEVAPALASSMQERMNLVSPDTATEALAERLLERVAGAGLDHMLPTLIADGYYTMAQLRDLFTSLSKSPPMAALRDRFIRHPTGEGLRAPDRRSPTKPLEELLRTGLDDL
ncbi:hypothetical protein [Umezawaea sp.]|uniref:hypothetical protein n=1 Tax=Umezawaea sp. TaxID=1955258 RepID=UPI002ED24C6F